MASRAGGSETATDAPLMVSVVATVRNEASTVGRLLDSLSEQTRAPDEVVVADGGSTDGTLRALRARAERGDLPLVVLDRPGANISAGRNAAVEAARGPVIAVTDAGVRLAPDWLASLTAPFDDGYRVASGFFVSDPLGAFETALGAATLPELREIDPARFLPSSRSVAFLKEDWSAVGGYPEWLDYCEDLVFDLRLLDRAGPAAFAADAVAAFRPRRSLASFARQYYLYARGDGKAGLWPRRHAVRYATYLGLAPALTAAGLAGHAWSWAALLAGGAAMVARPYRRLARQWDGLGPRERARALALVPVVRVVGDVAKMAGYPAGRWWRIRRRPPDWRPRVAAPSRGSSAPPDGRI